jgi:translocation and assembly module TamB
VRDHVEGATLELASRATFGLDSRALAANLSVQASDLRMRDPGLASILGAGPRLEARIDAPDLRDAVDLRELRLDGANLSLRANASLPRASGPLRARAELDLADIAGLSTLTGVELAGALRVEADVGGAPEAPSLEARLAPVGLRIGKGAAVGGSIAVRGIKNGASYEGAVQSTLRSDYGVLEAGSEVAWLPERSIALRKLVLRSTGAEAAGDVSVDLAARRVRGEISGAFKDLRVLSPLAGGRLEGRGDVRVSATDSGSQRLTLAVHWNDLRYGGAVHVQARRGSLDAALDGLTDKLGGSARLVASEVFVGPALFHRLQIDASGRDDRFQLRADTAGRYGHAFELRSVASVVRSAKGLDGRVRTLEGEVGGRPVHLSRELTWARMGQSFSIERLDLALAGGRVSGSMRLSEREALHGGVEITALPLDLVSLAAPSVDLHGTLSGTMSVAGTRSRPEVRFRASANSVEVGAVRGELPTVAMRAEGSLGARGLVADASITSADAMRFDVRVSFPPGGATPLGVEIRGNANAALLNGLGMMGEDRVGGVIEARMRLSGSVESPSLDGEIAWYDGFYENAAIGATLRGLEARLVGAGERLRLERFEAGDGDTGRIHGSGEIDFMHGLDEAVYSLDVGLRAARVARLDELEAEASGDLRIEGRGAAPLITGTLTIERAEVTVPERLPVSVVVFEDAVERNLEAVRPDRYAPRAVTATLPVGFDLAVKFPGRVFVRTTDADTEWEGDLHVRGESPIPRVSGTMKLVRGTFRLVNVNFKATTGTLAYDGGEKIDPDLDVRAEARKNDIDARLEISGRASAPEVRFTSDPVLPEDEVLSRLLFGKDARQLSPVESVQLAAAVARLSGRGGANLDPMGWLRRTLRVDTLDVTSADSADAGSQLSVGKYVSEKVFVSVNKGLTDTTSSAKVNLELTRQLSVESQLGSDRQGSLGLSWKWDY